MMLADHSSSSESQLIPEADLLHTWKKKERSLSSSDCSDGDVFIPRSNFLQCTRCFRTFREECMEDHWEEFHPQVECSFCHQSVDRFVLRKHQEHYCPERLRFCPRCYVQIPHSQLENHLNTCTTKEFDPPQEKVSPNKVLSFKGTVFEPHTRIAKSFINIARGHQDEKPPYSLVVKAENKNNWSTPSLDNLVNTFCPSTYCDSGNRHNSVVEDNQLLKKKISKPLKAALSKHEEEKFRNNETDFKQIVGIQSTLSATENLNPNYQYCRVQPPQRAIYLREVHQSLGNLVREESCRRTFVKSWLESYFLNKEKKNERLIKRKELLEDSIIDEAIELEMNKDSVSRISQEKWPYFVEHIQRRRSKWKDLGFDSQDCSSDQQTRESLHKTFKKLGEVDVQHNKEQYTTNTEFSEPNDLPYWKLIEKHLDENKDKKSHGDIGSLSKAKDKEEVFVGGFYRFCESCSQLFHEDHLAEHAAECWTQKQKAMSSKARQSINQIWKSKKEISLQVRLNKKGRSPLLNIPRPFVAGGTYSSLALSVAPHMKYHRSGHSKYAFITKKGRS